MRTLIVIDKKSFLGQQTDIEGAAARQLTGWLRRAGFDLDQVEVMRLGDQTYDQLVLEDTKLDTAIKV